MSFFDEVDYLLRNPDVRAVVRDERFPCGEHHYNAHGRAEGRVGRRVSLPPRAAYLLRRITSTAARDQARRESLVGHPLRAGRGAPRAAHGRAAGHLSVRVLSVSWKGIRTVRRKTVALAGVD